jgi:hypothetical protein
LQSRAFFLIRNIGRIRPYISNDACKILVSALVTSRLDYGNALLFGFSFEVRKIPLRFKQHFIGGAVTFTLGPWSCVLRRFPDKNDRCVFTRGSRGEVMLFFEKNI